MQSEVSSNSEIALMGSTIHIDARYGVNQIVMCKLLSFCCTSQGLTGAAVDLYTVASVEHEERGVTGAVGGILRQIPGTVVKPVILLSEATRHVLGGVKNQFVPDARREAREKWKTVDTND